MIAIGKMKVSADEGLMVIEYDDEVVYSNSAKNSDNIEQALSAAYYLGLKDGPNLRDKILDKKDQ